MGATTYQDSIDLDQDIVMWYSTIPRGMRFEEGDDESYLLANRPSSVINQTLALSVKTNMIRLILHRPYLKADPEAHPRVSRSDFAEASS